MTDVTRPFSYRPSAGPTPHRPPARPDRTARGVATVGSADTDPDPRQSAEASDADFPVLDGDDLTGAGPGATRPEANRDSTVESSPDSDAAGPDAAGPETAGSDTADGEAGDGEPTASGVTDPDATASDATDPDATGSDRADAAVAESDAADGGASDAGPTGGGEMPDRPVTSIEDSGHDEDTGETADDVGGPEAGDAMPPARRGQTTIASSVVEKVAGIAARKVAGVHRLGSGASRLVGAETGTDTGLAVRLRNGSATIGICVVVEYGSRVYDVANQLRSDVADAVESMLGVDVASVDIVVEDVHIPEA